MHADAITGRRLPHWFDSTDPPDHSAELADASERLATGHLRHKLQSAAVLDRKLDSSESNRLGNRGHQTNPALRDVVHDSGTGVPARLEMLVERNHLHGLERAAPDFSASISRRKLAAAGLLNTAPQMITLSAHARPCSR